VTSHILLIARQTIPRVPPKRFGLSMSGHRSEVICSGGLFSCLHTGQDSSGKKSNAFKIVINAVIPIAAVDAVRPFKGPICVFVCLKSFLGSLRHAVNLAKDFEHDVQRNRASRTQIEPGA